MKRLFILFLLIFGAVNFAFGGYVDSVDELIQTHTTPRSVAHWIYTNIQYKDDPADTDVWQNPYETFRLKTGDCEDMSILAMKVLEKHGYKCYLLMVWDEESGHAVCVVTLNDGFCWVSTEGYVRAFTKNLLKIPEEVMWDYTDYKYVGWDYIQRRIHRR